jgi:hypothetical protein
MAPSRTTYETRSGSHVVLEFADPTASRQGSKTPRPQMPMRANTWMEGAGGEQTRLQATFEALKKMGGGLATPKSEGKKGGGYFDVVMESI